LRGPRFGTGGAVLNRIDDAQGYIASHIWPTPLGTLKLEKGPVKSR